MKKLFAVLMTLLLVLSLPVLAMAEETTTAPETSADTTAEEVTATPEATEAPTEEVTEPESETEPEGETEAETAYKMQFGFYPETLLETLPVMGMGMLGIFLVTCVIVLAVVVLSKLGGKDKEESV